MDSVSSSFPFKPVPREIFTWAPGVERILWGSRRRSLDKLWNEADISCLQFTAVCLRPRMPSAIFIRHELCGPGTTREGNRSPSHTWNKHFVKLCSWETGARDRKSLPLWAGGDSLAQGAVLKYNDIATKSSSFTSVLTTASVCHLTPEKNEAARWKRTSILVSHLQGGKKWSHTQLRFQAWNMSY